tara:strand:+ start:495 stop:737 length:243 start_codon:yes stop_codon:yes gene_type:complete
VWFIIAMVYSTTIGDPEIFVMKSTFNNKKTCQLEYQTKPQEFMNDMFKLRPELKSMSFSCVDKQLLMELKISHGNQFRNL